MSILELRRGDRRDLTVTNLLDIDGLPTTFEVDDVLRWTAKRELRDPDANAYIMKSSLTVPDGPGGITFAIGTDTALISIFPGDFPLAFSRDRPFEWDLQLTMSGDDTEVHTLASGQGVILADVTLLFAPGP